METETHMRASPQACAGIPGGGGGTRLGLGCCSYDASTPLCFVLRVGLPSILPPLYTAVFHVSGYLHSNLHYILYNIHSSFHYIYHCASRGFLHYSLHYIPLCSKGWITCIPPSPLFCSSPCTGYLHSYLHDTACITLCSKGWVT
jgi:hypothetical protein